MEADMKWYVIHTYSGYENKVMQTLEQKVKSMGLENVINRILIPMEDEIDIKDGKKRTVSGKYSLATFSSKWKSMTVPGMSSAIHRVLPVLSARQPSLSRWKRKKSKRF